jgi:hypothetical protein
MYGSWSKLVWLWLTIEKTPAYNGIRPFSVSCETVVFYSADPQINILGKDRAYLSGAHDGLRG